MQAHSFHWILYNEGEKIQLKFRLSVQKWQSVGDVEESSTPEQIIKNVDNIKLRRCYQLIIKTLYWLFGFFTNTSK